MNLVCFIYTKVTFPSSNDQRLSAQATDTELINVTPGSASTLFSFGHSLIVMFLSQPYGHSAWAPEHPWHLFWFCTSHWQYKNEWPVLTHQSDPTESADNIKQGPWSQGLPTPMKYFL